jgi:hypothetical protein
MAGADNPFLCIVPFRWRRLWNHTARDGTRVKLVLEAKTHRQICRENFVNTVNLVDLERQQQEDR